MRSFREAWPMTEGPSHQIAKQFRTGNARPSSARVRTAPRPTKPADRRSCEAATRQRSCRPTDESTEHGAAVRQTHEVRPAGPSGVAASQIFSPRPNQARSLRGRKYTYYESATAVHFFYLIRCVMPLCASKDRITVLAVTLSRYGYFYRADS